MNMDRDLTFGEIFQAIREGDVRIAAGFTLECLIMASPFALIGAAVWLMDFHAFSIFASGLTTGVCLCCALLRWHYRRR